MDYFLDSQGMYGMNVYSIHIETMNIFFALSRFACCIALVTLGSVAHGQDLYASDTGDKNVKQSDPTVIATTNKPASRSSSRTIRGIADPYRPGRRWARDEAAQTALRRCAPAEGSKASPEKCPPSARTLKFVPPLRDEAFLPCGVVSHSLLSTAAMLLHSRPFSLFRCSPCRDAVGAGRGRSGEPVAPPVAAPAFLDVVTFEFHADGENHKVVVTTGSHPAAR